MASISTSPPNSVDAAPRRSLRAAAGRWLLMVLLFVLPLGLMFALPSPWPSSSHPRNTLAKLGLKLLQRGHDRETLILVLVLAALIVLGLGMRRGGRLAAVVIAVSIPLTYAVLRLIARLGGHPPSGAVSVGYAIYAGYPKSIEFVQVPFFVLVPAVVALVALHLHKQFARPAAPTEIQGIAVPGRRRKWAGAAIVALLAIGLAAYFCPNLESANPVRTPPISLQWDSNNVVVWQYLIQTGAKPFKDFWYPYCGQMLFDLAFPYGTIALALHQFVLFALLLLAIHLNTGKSIGATLAIFGSVFGLYVSGFFWFPERYGPIVNVVLAYTAIDQGARRLQARHVLFWLATVHTVLLEPTSALYASVPVLLSCILDAWRAPVDFCRHLLGRLGRDFAAPAAVLAAVGIYLAVRGELSGFLSFMASLGAQADYGAYPLNLRDWLRFGSPAEGFVLWSVVVLVGAGLVQEFRSEGEKERIGRIMLLLGVAAAMMMLKLFVRPQMTAQILIINVAGVLFSLFGRSQANTWQRAGAVLAAGLVFAILAVSPVPRQVAVQLRSTVDRVQASIPYLELDRRQRDGLVSRRFASEHFLLTDAHRRTLDELTALERSGHKVRPLFVLSDDPIFYVLTRTRPYFHTNGYNACPIQEQKRMLALLEAEPPEVILWRPTDVGVDGVPPALRDPLLYEYVILHYVPVRDCGDAEFALLRRRQLGEPVAVDFWRERLGFLHLGHLPRYSSRARFRAQMGGLDEDVAEFLTIKIRDADALPALSGPLVEVPAVGGYRPSGRPLLIPIECGGRRFFLALSVVPEQSEYHILLNRVWFWGALRKAGLSPTLGEIGPGIEAHIERRALDDSILY